MVVAMAMAMALALAMAIANAYGSGCGYGYFCVSCQNTKEIRFTCEMSNLRSEKMDRAFRT